MLKKLSKIQGKYTDLKEAKKMDRSLKQSFFLVNREAKNGVFFSTIMGVVCKDGVILGTEKIVINKMMVSGTDKRAYNITRSSGCVVNGLVPDGRALMYRGREEAKQYEDNFGIKAPAKVLAERLAGYNQMHTMYANYRPVGSTMIMCAHDIMQGHTLWMVEPSGTVF